MYTIKREISSSNVNKNGELHLHEAFNFMLDICAFHMDNIKILRDFFEQNGYSVFLKAAQIDILKTPTYSEKLIITDEIYSGKGIYGLRGVTVKNAQNEVYYKAHLTGVFVDMETGTPIKLTDEVINDAEICGNKIDMEILPRKISIRVNIKRVEKIVIPQSFIDMNQHMNSSYYLRLAEDILNEEYDYNRVRIEYKMQVKQGSTVRIELMDSETPCVCIYEDKENTHLATVEFSKV